MKISLQIRDSTHGTYTCANEQSHANSITEDCEGRKDWKDIVLQKDWDTSPITGGSLFSSTKGTLSNMLATKNGWTKSQLSSHAAHRPSAFGMHSTRTEKHPHFNFQEQILGYERDFIICPWEDRNRTFEEFVSKKSALQFACEMDC